MFHEFIWREKKFINLFFSFKHMKMKIFKYMLAF